MKSRPVLLPVAMSESCSAAAGLYVDISDSCYHRGPCRGLLSVPTPEAMLVFDSHVAIGNR